MLRTDSKKIYVWLLSHTQKQQFSSLMEFKEGFDILNSFSKIYNSKRSCKKNPSPIKQNILEVHYLILIIHVGLKTGYIFIKRFIRIKNHYLRITDICDSLTKILVLIGTTKLSFFTTSSFCER